MADSGRHLPFTDKFFGKDKILFENDLFGNIFEQNYMAAFIAAIIIERAEMKFEDYFFIAALDIESGNNYRKTFI